MEENAKNKEDSYRAFRDGLEKTGIKYFLRAGFYICPDQPMLSYTLGVAVMTYVTLIIVLSLCIVTICVSLDDIMILSETFAHLCIIAPMLISIISMHTYKNLNEKIFKIISDEFFEYECDDNTEYVKVKDANKLILLRIQKTFEYLVIPSFTMWAFIAPLLERIFDDGSIQKNSLLMYNLPVALWVPFDQTFVAQYYLVYVLEVLVGILLVFYLLGYAVSVLSFCLQIGAQIKILLISLLNLEKRATTLYENKFQVHGKKVRIINKQLLHVYDESEFQYCLQFCLKENLMHYEKIKEFFSLFQQYIKTITLSIFAATSLVLCNFAFLLTKVKSYAIAIKFGSMFVAGTVHLLFYCACGTLVLIYCESISDGVYYCPWTKLPQSVKRSVMIFQIRLSRYFEMRAGIFPINLNTFIEIMRTAYSIFNILNTTEI